MRLFSSDSPEGRPSKQRVGGFGGFHHHELAGRRRPGNLRRTKREHVVVGRQRMIGDYVGGDVGGHRGSILRAKCATCGC
jgi:hypothetical protein